MTDKQFSARQEAAFAALDGGSSEDNTAAPRPNLPAVQPRPEPRGAVQPPPQSRAEPAPHKPDSPTGGVIGGFMVAVVGLVLIAVGSTENQEPLTLAGIVVTLVGSTLMFAAVIALGVRWGIQLSDYARYQRRN